jgi:non-homologous end joining protein Ku
LIDALEGELDPETLRDEHAERVHALVKAKAGGKKIALVHPRQKRATKSLADALSKSVARAKEKNVA